MDPVLLRLLLVVAGVALVTLLGLALRRRDGRIVASATPESDGGASGGGADTADDAPRLDASHLDAVGLDTDGAAAGAVLLGSPTCAPCDAVKAILSDLAQEREAFRWVYADAADHLDLAREHRVLRVPTLFVVDAEGRILGRTSGVPRPDDLRQLLDGRDVDLAA
ncbi:MAG: thioredoxin family protein [Nitriliruptoraceae bacterium]|nr:thioredoxin family protein [Nitriliruptoraceae bacterium]